MRKLLLFMHFMVFTTLLGQGPIPPSNLQAQVRSSTDMQYTVPATGGYGRTVSNKLYGTSASAGDFGAIGDNSAHAVSTWCTYAGGTRFTAANAGACLTAIQAAYSFITAVTQQIDYAAIQACMNWASSVQGECVLDIPSGAYVIDTPLLIKSNTILSGKSWGFGSGIVPTGNFACINADGPAQGGGLIFRVVIRDLMCNMTNATAYAGGGIILNAVYQTKLERVWVYNVSNVDEAIGISILSSNNPVLEDVVVYGITGRTEENIGIKLLTTSNAVLINCDVEFVFHGIQVAGVGHTDIFGGHMADSVVNLIMFYTAGQAVNVNGGLWTSPNGSTAVFENITGPASALHINGARLYILTGGNEVAVGGWYGNYITQMNGGAFSIVQSGNLAGDITQYTGEFMVKAGYKSGPGLDTTIDDEDDVFINRTGATITITEVYCRSDAGTPTVNLLRNDGSVANIFTSDLTCDLTPTGTNGTDGILTSFVSGENLIADGQAVNLNVTAASTANVATMVVKYTKVIQ